jgi:hypothetical protein
MTNVIHGAIVSGERLCLEKPIHGPAVIDSGSRLCRSSIASLASPLRSLANGQPHNESDRADRPRERGRRCSVATHCGSGSHLAISRTGSTNARAIDPDGRHAGSAERSPSTSLLVYAGASSVRRAFVAWPPSAESSRLIEAAPPPMKQKRRAGAGWMPSSLLSAHSKTVGAPAPRYPCGRGCRSGRSAAGGRAGWCPCVRVGRR